MSHELFRPDHAANAGLRALALRYAMHDCVDWLADNSVAVSNHENTKRLGTTTQNVEIVRLDELETSPASKRMRMGKSFVAFESMKTKESEDRMEIRFFFRERTMEL